MEEELQMATVAAFNTLYSSRDSMLEILKNNIATVIDSPESTLDEVQTRLEEVQQELLKKANSKQNYDALVQEIMDLREKKQNIMVEAAEQNGYKRRITELEEYLQNYQQELIEYDDQLVRLHIQRIMVYSSHFEIEFKAGFKLNIER